MDPWIHGSAAGAAARAAAGAAASAAAVCIYYISLAGALRAPLDVRDKVHTAAAEAAAPAAALAADPWIHGSISFIMNHIFNNEMNHKFHQPYVLAEGLHWFALCKPAFWVVNVANNDLCMRGMNASVEDSGGIQDGEEMLSQEGCRKLEVTAWMQQHLPSHNPISKDANAAWGVLHRLV